MEQINQEKKLKKMQEKTIYDVMNTMHTFTNPEFEKIREELISGNMSISISDQKNYIQIK